MKVDFLYGDRVFPLEISDHQVKQILKAKPLPVPAAEEALVKEALAHPIDALPLGNLVRQGEKVCVIIGDMTRLWVRHHLLVSPILDELNRGGIPDRDIFVVSATGDHREQTPEEHRQLMGEEAYRRVRIFDHRAKNKDEAVYLGTTTHGTPVHVNKRVVEADRVIMTGGIVYHFLAGWGGGKKAIMPGLSSYETIMKNHSLAFNAEEGSGLNTAVCAGRSAGNPCSDDMLQGAGMVAPDFLVNTIINEEVHRIARVVAGNYITAYHAGCEYVNEHFGVEISSPAEVVMASCGGYPKDINFYQSYKTIYNANFALKPGGTLILVSESREGIGSEDFDRMINDFPDNRQREAALRSSYTIGGHMGYHTALIAEENDVLVLTGLPEAKVHQMGMLPIRNLEEGLSFVKKKHHGIPPSIIMPHGSTTFPCLGR